MDGLHGMSAIFLIFDVINKVLDLASKDYIVGLSILGGEPMHPVNLEGTTKLANAFKERYPDKTIWAWTGYLFDQYLMDKEITNYLDVVVDGQYVDELHDFRLKWKGSSNQRVIDVKKSKQAHKVILFEEKDLVGV